VIGYGHRLSKLAEQEAIEDVIVDCFEESGAEELIWIRSDVQREVPA
jgi:hypothetical protein